MSKISDWTIELDSRKTEHEKFLDDYNEPREPAGYDEEIEVSNESV